MAIVVWGGLSAARWQRATPALVLDGITVIDVEHGRRLSAQRVLILGNHIQAVGGTGQLAIPAGARVIDTHGKYLIPGLWDMHTHPAFVNAHNAAEVFYPLFIANGVTGIRDAGARVPLDTLIQWRRDILAGTRVGPPRQVLAGPALDEHTPCRREGLPQAHLCVADPADARHVADSLVAAGADFLKTYDLGRATYFAIAAEARRLHVPFGGHLNQEDQPSALEASDSGVTFIDHPNLAGGLEQRCFGRHASLAQCAPVAKLFNQQGTWWVPTLVIVAELGKQSPKIHITLGDTTLAISQRLRANGRAFWSGTYPQGNWLYDGSLLDSMGRQTPPSAWHDAGNGLLSIMHKVGFPILAGTDVVGTTRGIQSMLPGFALHAELAMLVAEGLTPLEALRAATLNPAKALHRTDSLGTVAPGKLADLVILDADPLADITNTTTIEAVIANGHYFDRTALDQLLASAQRHGPVFPKGSPRQQP